MTNKIKAIISYLALTVGTTVVAAWVIGLIVEDSVKTQSKTVQEKVDSLKVVESKIKTVQDVSEYPDYQALRKMDSITIAENFVSYSPKNTNPPQYTIHDTMYIKGKLLRGYLDVQVSINDEPFTTWESIYFKVFISKNLRFPGFGGHLFRSETLKVPPDSNVTHLLYTLNRIPYLPSLPYSDSRRPDYFDLFGLINSYSNVKLTIFISSLRKAKINSIKLYYESDPEYNNGKCELNIVK